MTNAFEKAYAHSMSDPEAFWAEAAEGITWTKKWDKVLDDSNAPFYRWFSGGELNTCYNCLDRHIEDGRGDQAYRQALNVFKACVFVQVSRRGPKRG